MTREQYIQTYKSLVIDSTKGTGLFPSLMMAQAMLESGNGASNLAAGYNNHFGIKAGTSWRGRMVNMRTREVITGQGITTGAYFRVYESPVDSFRDRNQMLISSSHYRNAGVFNTSTPEEQAMALQRAGYATDPNYGNVLISLINEYNLKSLDTENKKKVYSGLELLRYVSGFVLQELFS
jgi:flagellum-specific peptidoglycan hydrolase FlgJ